MTPLIDLSTDFGARAERRLREDRIGWLVTVGADGTPQPNPVWFSWDGESLLIYSEPAQAKLTHIERNSNVALHLDSRDSGDDIVIVLGRASLDPSAPAVDQNPHYVTKYRTEMDRLKLGTPTVMAATYSAVIRVLPRKVRGY